LLIQRSVYGLELQNEFNVRLQACTNREEYGDDKD